MLKVYLITLTDRRKIANDVTNCSSMPTENNIHVYYILTVGDHCGIGSALGEGCYG